MSNIKGTIVNIKDFLSNKSVEITIQNSDSDHVVFKLDAERSYCIPDFQREIRWSVENLYELMSDIYSCDKFLGNVILTRHKNNKYYIIDGQQRISMLFMLVHFIKRKYYEDLSVDDALCQLINDSFSGYTEFTEQDYALNGIDKEKDNQIEKSDKLGQIDKFNGLWKSIFENDILSDSTKAGKFLKNLERCEINVILSEQDSTNYSIEYFLDVNLKGVRLDDEDIFKGYLFYLDDTKEIRDLWVDLKQKARYFNKICSKKSKSKNDCYPLMKLIEHFFYCNLYSFDKYKDIQFAEDFRIKEKVQIGTTWHYPGEHILKVINSVGYMRESLKTIIKFLDVANNVVSNESPNDFFKGLFETSTGIKILDDDEIKIFFQYFRQVLFDRTMMVSKAILMKYILSIVFDSSNENKNDYKKLYMVFMFSSLFSIFENKKGIEPISKILKSENWDDEIIKSLSDYLNPATIRTRKRGAEFRFATNPDDEEKRYHSIMLAAVYNFFHFDGTEVKIRKKKTKALRNFLVNTEEYSVEHFIINQSKKCTVKLDDEEKLYEYVYSTETKKYSSSIFNYIYIPQELNSSLENCIVQDKLSMLSDKDISCEYSKMIVQNVKKCFLPIGLKSAEDAKQKRYMDRYFSFDFREQYGDFVELTLGKIAERFS